MTIPVTERDPLASLHRANHVARPRGVIRCQPEDFKVNEALSFEPSGQGEHRYLQIRKRGHNSQWVVKTLAAAAKVKPRDIGFAGHKDRHGVTTQWFSLMAPSELPLSPLPAGMELIDETRHEKKLKRGALRGNDFDIVIRDLSGDQSGLEGALRRIGQCGFPNYFGEQRFGRDGANLQRALDWFANDRPPRGRNTRGFALSAARSELFNRLLSWRIEVGSWCRLSVGDLAQLAGSQSVFAVSAVDEELRDRLESGDIHPTGPLWGEGVPATDGEVLKLESRLLDKFPALTGGLAQQRLRQERRGLRVIPADLSWSAQEGGIRLRFSLPRGSYATALLREIIDYEDRTITDATAAHTEEDHA